MCIIVSFSIAEQSHRMQLSLLHTSHIRTCKRLCVSLPVVSPEPIFILFGFVFSTPIRTYIAIHILHTPAGLSTSAPCSPCFFNSYSWWCQFPPSVIVRQLFFLCFIPSAMFWLVPMFCTSSLFVAIISI